MLLDHFSANVDDEPGGTEKPVRSEPAQGVRARRRAACGDDGESLVEALLGSGGYIQIVDDPAERVWIWSDLHLWDDTAQRLLDAV